MNAEQLYELIKRALDFFGLHWSQKDEILVSIREDRIVFTYGDDEVSWRVK